MNIIFFFLQLFQLLSTAKGKMNTTYLSPLSGTVIFELWNPKNLLIQTQSEELGTLWMYEPSQRKNKSLSVCAIK